MFFSLSKYSKKFKLFFSSNTLFFFWGGGGGGILVKVLLRTDGITFSLFHQNAIQMMDGSVIYVG